MRSVDWNKWSSVAEILSAIAVLFTLVYLGVQTNQNTQAINAASILDVTRDETEFLKLVFENPDVMRAIYSPRLSQEEAVRLHNYYGIIMRNYENYWALHKLGVLSEERLDGYMGTFVGAMSSERARNWWNRMKLGFDPGFVERVDTLFQRVPVRPLIPVDFTELFAPMEFPPEVEVSGDTLDRYLGSYLVDGEVITITRTGARLFLQPPGGESIELAAAAESEFFGTNDPRLRITFVTDDVGAVSELVVNQGPRGQKVSDVGR